MTHEARLFLSQDEWEKLSDKRSDPYLDRIAENNMQVLDLLEERVQNIGVYTTHWRSDPPWRILKARVLRRTAAWYLTRDEQHLEVLSDCVRWFSSAENWQESWGKPMLNHYGLTKGDMTYCLTFLLDACGKYLSDADRTALCDALRNLALAHYIEGFDAGEWWRHCDFNWSSATHANAALGALYIQPENPDLAAEVRRRAHDGLGFVIDNFPIGGGWTEGLMYQTTTMAHLSDYVMALHRVEGNDLGLSENRNFIDTLDYRLYMMGGDDKPVNFSNCNEGSGEYFMPQAFWWAKHLNRPDWMAFEEAHTKDFHDSHGLFHDIEAFWCRPVNPEKAEARLKPLKHFKGLDWMKWTGEKTWFALRSGYNGGNHNNLDLGHFVFGAGEDRFLCDPGYGASATKQHNAAIFRGASQAVASTAEIIRLHPVGKGGFYLCCDLAETYPHVLAHYYRHVLLIDEEDLLVIDHALAKKGHRLGAKWNLQTRLPFEKSESGATFKGEQKTLQLQFLTPTHDQATEEDAVGKAAFWSLMWSPRVDLPSHCSAMYFSLKPKEARFERQKDLAVFNLGNREFIIDLAEACMIQPPRDVSTENALGIGR
ncbi:MAG: hypothetical protein ACLFQ6_05775 [Candidatus Sumerlaeia bacterium]